MRASWQLSDDDRLLCYNYNEAVVLDKSDIIHVRYFQGPFYKSERENPRCFHRGSVKQRSLVGVDQIHKRFSIKKESTP